MSASHLENLLNGECALFKELFAGLKLLTSIFLLHNFRTDVVGLNQITAVFSEDYEQYINLEGYDRIGRYFANVDD
jgi:hypothetical protein